MAAPRSGSTSPRALDFGAVNRWGDRILGIVLGLVIGIAIVAVFVFVFSEETVDAPSLEGGARQEQAR